MSYSYTHSFLIELDSIAGRGCSGSVKIYADEYVEEPEKPTGRHYQETFNIPSTATSKIIRLYQSLKINQIPEWDSGFDGTDFDIDFTDEHGTSHRKYWSPDKRNPDQVNVRVFVDSTHRLLRKAEAIFDLHSSFECNYVKDIGGDVECRVLKKKQKRKYNAERDNYRKSHGLAIQ